MTGIEAVRLMGEGLPADLVVSRVLVDEALSRPYVARVDVLTEDPTFLVSDLMRQRLALTLEGAGRQGRIVDGIVRAAALTEVVGARVAFTVELQPSLAALSQRVGSRIFQDQTAVDIIKTMLTEAAVDARAEWRLQHEHAERPYTVQYRESELNFVSRLLEDEGIHYFFVHDADGHRLVFTDVIDGFGGDETFRLSALGVSGALPVASVRRRRRLRRAAVHLRDYDPERPAVAPESTATADAPLTFGRYAYPGGFVDGDVAARRAQVALDADRHDADEISLVTPTTGLYPGAVFTLEGVPDARFEGRFVVKRIESHASGETKKVDATVVAVPDGVRHAPPRRAHRPRAPGVMSARVVGETEGSQQIHTDALGRVKVMFPWDRSGRSDATASTWLRVQQLNLGGAMILPRVGWEVAVAFHHGDPDRPYVVGRLYDAENAPPAALPAEGPSTVLSSRVSPGGAGENAIALGDGAGGQTFAMNAQKDLNVVVGDGREETVAGGETVKVGANAAVTITGADAQTIGGNQTVDVGDARQNKVGGAQTVSVGGSETITTLANLKESGAARDESIGGNRLTISNGVRDGVASALTRSVGSVQGLLAAAGVVETCGGALSTSAGAVIGHVVGGTHAEVVSGAKSQSCTAAEGHLAAGYEQSAASVTQLVGGARVRLVSGDITLMAPQIMIGGGAGHLIAAGGSVKLNGGPITIKGPAIKLSGIINKSGGSLKMG
ncbi:MAG: type VI secretion system tip protein TssI/VgrG [Myxococcota bacterium]